MTAMTLVAKTCSDLASAQQALITGSPAEKEASVQRLRVWCRERASDEKFAAEIFELGIVPLLLGLCGEVSVLSDAALLSIWETLAPLMESAVLKPQFESPAAIRSFCGLMESDNGEILQIAMVGLCTWLKVSSGSFDDWVVRKFFDCFNRVIPQFGTRHRDIVSVLIFILDSTIELKPKLYLCMVPVAVKLMEAEEVEVRQPCLTILQKIIFCGKEDLSVVKLAILEANMTEALVRLLSHPVMHTARTAFVILTDISATDEAFARKLVRTGEIRNLGRFFKDPHWQSSVNACSTLICIVRLKCRGFIQQIIDQQLLPEIVRVLKSEASRAHEHAICVLREISVEGSLHQVFYLVDSGAIHALCGLLDSQAAEPAAEALVITSGALEANKEYSRKFRSSVLACGAKPKLRQLTWSRSQNLRKVSRTLLKRLEVFDY